MAQKSNGNLPPTVVAGIENYARLKYHAQFCDECLAELTLALVALVVTGELRFDVRLCPHGTHLLAQLRVQLGAR